MLKLWHRFSDWLWWKIEGWLDGDQDEDSGRWPDDADEDSSTGKPR